MSVEKLTSVLKNIPSGPAPPELPKMSSRSLQYVGMILIDLDHELNGSLGK